MIVQFDLRFFVLIKYVVLNENECNCETDQWTRNYNRALLLTVK